MREPAILLHGMQSALLNIAGGGDYEPRSSQLDTGPDPCA